MASLAFDTHAFVKDLTASGMPTEQAEVLARTYATLLTDRLATKDDIALLRRDIAAMDEKFTGMIAAQDEKFTGMIAAQDEKFSGMIAAQGEKFEAELASLRKEMKGSFAAIDERFAAVDEKFAAQDERFDIKLAALEDRLNARITYSQLATIIILTAVMGAFNIWG